MRTVAPLSTLRVSPGYTSVKEVGSSVMDCPKDGVELETVEDEHVSFKRCTECGGIWMDVSDLNRVLLRHNLSGLEKLGGTANIEELTGQCPDCQVDLVVIEGGHKRTRRYDTCESCGGIWLDQGIGKTGETVEAITEGVVDFYKKFAQT